MYMTSDIRNDLYGVDRIGYMEIKLSDRFNGFKLMSLKEYLLRYKNQISIEYNFNRENTTTNIEIIVLVDTRDIAGTMTPEIRRKCRMGQARRKRLKQQHSYNINVFNRIHGYFSLANIVVTNKTHIPEGKKVLNLSLLCSSSYSNIKGIGSELMRIIKEFGNNSGVYTDIVLEVANDADNGKYDSDSESDSEDDDESIVMNDDLITLITKEFSRKILRVDVHGTAVYNVDSEYIYDIVYAYINDEQDEDEDSDDDNSVDDDEDSDDDDEDIEDDNEDSVDDDEDSDDDGDDDEDSDDDDEDIEDDNEDSEEDDSEDDSEEDDSEYDIEYDSEDESSDYGGYWYLKGKESQIELYRFYERCGFIEDGNIHKFWGIFGDIPFPSMIYKCV